MKKIKFAATAAFAIAAVALPAQAGTSAGITSIVLPRADIQQLFVKAAEVPSFQRGELIEVKAISKQTNFKE